MISFHLGAPGVFADMPAILADIVASRMATDRHIQTQHIVETRLRPYLNSRSKDPKVLDMLRSAALTAVEMLLQDMSAVVSQPELFGATAELMRPGKTFPKIERRFGRLCEVFEGTPWTAHMVITNQVDVIWQLSGVAPQRKLQAIHETGLSWSNLVWRMRRMARNGDLFVWDFERPDVMAPALVEYLLQVSRGELGREVYQRIAKCSVRPGPDLFGHCSSDDVLAVERLDELYEIELEKISRIAGVTLVRVEE